MLQMIRQRHTNFKTLVYASLGVVALVGMIMLLTGCKFIGADPAPPTQAEAKFFEIKTNYVDVPVLVQRTVNVTNVIVEHQTNEVGIIVAHTNEVVLPKYEVVTLTNHIPQYEWAPREETKAMAGTAGAISNLVAPGSGGLVAGILSGIAIMYGKLRSSKRTGGALVQNIATLREFLKTIPNGEKYDAAIVQYLRDHQKEVGVVDQVATLIETFVNDQQAKGAASEVKEALKGLQS